MQLEPDLQTFANSLPPARISVLRDEESRSVTFDLLCMTSTFKNLFCLKLRKK